MEVLEVVEAEEEVGAELLLLLQLRGDEEMAGLEEEGEEEDKFREVVKYRPDICAIIFEKLFLFAA